jgi:hypothetical protein
VPLLLLFLSPSSLLGIFIFVSVVVVGRGGDRRDGLFGGHHGCLKDEKI